MPFHRLLLIDDSPEFLFATESCLLDTFDVSTAESGDEALARGDLQSFQVICSDLSMPNRLGIDVLEEVHRRSEPAGLMLMTGFGEFDRTLERRLAAIDASFVRKPFDPDFFNQIAKALAEMAVLRATRIARTQSNR